MTEIPLLPFNFVGRLIGASLVFSTNSPQWIGSLFVFVVKPPSLNAMGWEREVIIDPACLIPLAVDVRRLAACSSSRTSAQDRKAGNSPPQRFLFAAMPVEHMREKKAGMLVSASVQPVRRNIRRHPVQ